MSDTTEHLLLKWGTLKGWSFNEGSAAHEAFKRYHEEPTSMGAMQQRDTDTQKQAICDMIDAVDGPITNDWTGEDMTRDEAKEYVLEYRR
ncbi:hypothetical protein [Parasphingopyxis sp.]|uniref:hypothetical protein n=1 Tax=Parasphingopyxis sp. TaxID=1920299 RepID=UPI00262F76EF|nr:hypothetical protein [Parasphingopyxis sp.]